MWQQLSNHQQKLKWAHGIIYLSNPTPDFHQLQKKPNTFLITIPQIKSLYSVPDTSSLIQI